MIAYFKKVTKVGETFESFLTSCSKVVGGIALKNYLIIFN